MSEQAVKGLKELQAFLDTLPAKVEQNIMRGALRAGANVVLKAARLKVGAKTGQLRKGLKVKTAARYGVVTATIKPTGPHAYLGKFLEFGTRPHFISVTDDNKRVNGRLSAKRGVKTMESMTTVNRRYLLIGGRIVGPSVSHPGVRARPFLRPALDENVTQATVAVGNYIKKRLATKHGINTPEITLDDEE